MNNYLKLLLFLKQHEGDGKLHNIEPLFPEINLDEMKAIIGELDQEGLIKYIGRETRYDSFIVEVNHMTGQSKMTESPLNRLNDITPPTPLSAKITFKGSKYLKEELEMQQTGKYNINIGDGSTANLILESTSYLQPYYDSTVAIIIRQFTYKITLFKMSGGQILTKKTKTA